MHSPEMRKAALPQAAFHTPPKSPNDIVSHDGTQSNDPLAVFMFSKERGCTIAEARALMAVRPADDIADLLGESPEARNNVPRPPPGGFIGVHPSTIPQALKDTPQWMPYVRTPRLGKPGKFDKRPALGRGTHRPQDWATFDEAMALLPNPNYAGLSLCLTGLTGLVTFDLDGAVADGVVKDWAREVVAQIGSYTELSPSGNGLRIFAKGDAPGDWANHEIGIEVYSGKTPRHATVTGCHLEGTPTELKDLRPELLESLEAKYRKSKPSAVAAGPLPDLVDVGPIEDAGLPEHVLKFLRDGEEGADGSAALFTAACALCKLHPDERVYSYLVNNANAWEVVSRHRARNDEGEQYEARCEYLWVHQVAKARALVGPALGPVGSLFDDVSTDDLGADPGEFKGWQEVKLDLLTVPAVEYLIDEFFAHSLCVLAGPPGIGKTTAILALVLIVAGFTLQGCPMRAEKRRKVIYVSEDLTQVQSLLVSYCAVHQLDREEVINWLVFIEAQRSEADHFLTLAHNIKAHTIDGERPLLVADTAPATWALANENDNSEVSAYIAAVKSQIFVKGRTPVLVAAHTPKAAGKEGYEATARGASAFTGDATLTMALYENDQGTKCLRLGKRRYHPEVVELQMLPIKDHQTTTNRHGRTQNVCNLIVTPVPCTPATPDEVAARKEERKHVAKLWAEVTRVTKGADFITEACGSGSVLMHDTPGGPQHPPVEGTVLKWTDVRKAVGCNNNVWASTRDAIAHTFDVETLDAHWSRYTPRDDGTLN